MKKYLFISALASILLAGCKEDETPELSVIGATLTFSAEGESKSFEVKSNTAWTITKTQNATWITTISPTSGNGDATINITVAANTSTTDTRNDELTVSAEEITPIKVSISQEKAISELSVEPDILDFVAEGESKFFEVKSNTVWTITGHETQTWITTVSPTSSSGNEMVCVTVAANPSAVQARSVTLTLAVEGITPMTVEVQQAKRPAPKIISFEPTEANYGVPIIITGKNFSTVKDENIVKFNGFTAEIISATADVIWAVVPKNINCSGKVSVMVGDTTVLSAANFTYLPTITVSTLAGSGVAGFDDGAGNTARFHLPDGVAVDAANNVYVADNLNHRIRKITPTGEVSTLAGSGVAGFADGAGNTAQFYYPYDVAVDAANNVYVADRFNYSVRKIAPTGEVTTLAGNGKAGFVDGAGTAAQFNRPVGITVDASGNVYVADESNHCIRKITPTGVVTTLAGNGSEGFVDGVGTTAQFHYPYGVAVDASDNVYVSDRFNLRIRKITSAGVVSTLAGNGTQGFTDGLGNAAQFDNPNGVTVDVFGNVYVADQGNHLIRKITPAGLVTTLAGSVSNGWGTMFALPGDVAVNASGNVVYVADGNNHRIRKITIE